MSDPSVVRRVVLAPHHVRTGKTRHIVRGVVAPAPFELRIVKYEGDTGFYLFHCDDSGTEFVDTYHDTIDDAMNQAKWEFGIELVEW